MAVYHPLTWPESGTYEDELATEFARRIAEDIQVIDREIDYQTVQLTIASSELCLPLRCKGHIERDYIYHFRAHLAQYDGTSATYWVEQA